MPLQPLIPDPNDPMQSGALPPQLPKNLGGFSAPDTKGLGSLGGLPPLSDASGTATGNAGFGGLKPLVTNPRQQQEQELQSKLTQKPKGFWQNLRHVLGTAAMVGGDIVDPGATKIITQQLGREGIGPAANEYRQKHLAGLQGQDVAEQQAAAKETLDASQGVEAQARAAELQEATKEAPDKLELEKGRAKSEEDLQASETAGSTPDIATYRSLVGMGMSASDALKEIERDKAMALKAPSMESKPGMYKGVPAFGNFHPDTGQYTDAQGNPMPGFQPQPQPAMLPPWMYDPNAGDVFRPKPGQPLPAGVMTPTQLGQGAAQDVKDTKKTAQDVKSLDASLQMMHQFAKDNTGASDFGIIMNFAGDVKPENVGKLRWQKAEQDYVEGLRSSFGDLEAWKNKIAGGQRLTSEERNQMIHAVQIVRDAKNAEAGGQAASGGAPAVGTVEGGFKFKGGDPSKQANWEQVKK